MLPKHNIQCFHWRCNWRRLAYVFLILIRFIFLFFMKELFVEGCLFLSNAHHDCHCIRHHRHRVVVWLVGWLLACLHAWCKYINEKSTTGLWQQQYAYKNRSASDACLWLCWQARLFYIENEFREIVSVPVAYTRFQIQYVCSSKCNWTFRGYKIRRENLYTKSENRIHER